MAPRGVREQILNEINKTTIRKRRKKWDILNLPIMTELKKQKNEWIDIKDGEK